MCFLKNAFGLCGSFAFEPLIIYSGSDESVKCEMSHSLKTKKHTENYYLILLFPLRAPDLFDVF